MLKGHIMHSTTHIQQNGIFWSWQFTLKTNIILELNIYKIVTFMLL